MKKHLRRFDEYHGMVGGIEHGRGIIQDCFLAVRKAESRIGIYINTSGKEHFTTVDQHAVAGKYILPQLYDIVKAGAS